MLSSRAAAHTSPPQSAPFQAQWAAILLLEQHPCWMALSNACTGCLSLRSTGAATAAAWSKALWLPSSSSSAILTSSKPRCRQTSFRIYRFKRSVGCQPDLLEAHSILHLLCYLSSPSRCSSHYGHSSPQPPVSPSSPPSSLLTQSSPIQAGEAITFIPMDRSVDSTGQIF